MVLRIAILALLLAGCSEPQPTGEAADPGKEFFEMRCAECHGIDGAAQISGAPDLTVSKLTEAQVRKIILEGKNAMPPFKIWIESDSLLQQTMEHVLSLRKEK